MTTCSQFRPSLQPARQAARLQRHSAHRACPHRQRPRGIRNYVALQDQRRGAIYCIVDYHALTSSHDRDFLRRQTREMAAALLALGLDPEGARCSCRADRPEVAELCWLFSTVTPVELAPAHAAYKEKREYQPEDVNHGLLTYPVLQAADIALYKASFVPVGKDQAAHLELAPRDRARVQRRYGGTFPEPQAVYTEAPACSGPTACGR